MKRILLAVPKGYQYVELAYPDYIDKYIKKVRTRPIRELPNGAEYSHVAIDEINRE